MKIAILKGSDVPIYKQIVEDVISGVKSGQMQAGALLPSMNELAERENISKETVKKAYAVLRDRGYIEPRQGKGFYVRESSNSSPRVLVLFDKLSTYKQLLYNRMAERMGANAQLEIRLHNQDVKLLEFFLDEALDKYDYYVVTPHFPLDEATQKAARKQLKRIPFRKMIVLDNWLRDLEGNYGCVYQDFGNDIAEGLSQGLEDLRRLGSLCVITLPTSLYHHPIEESVRHFCNDNGISVQFHSRMTPELVRKGETYLLLNSQLDSGLLSLVEAARAKGLEVGSDIRIINYNDSPIDALVLGGLTTVSTDFMKMGELAAQMILTRKMGKVKCDFRMTRRSTF